MQLVLASGNRGKIKEFKIAFDNEIVGMHEIAGKIDITEDSDTFAGNALKKARTVYELCGENTIVISDDSGISVPVLGGEPGIRSARYAGENANDRENLEKLCDEMKRLNIHRADAYYTAALAIVCKYGEYVAHGWMYGKVIDTPSGDGGFGYDPIFIPEGFDRTLGELEESTKVDISHRAKAIELAKPIVKKCITRYSCG